MDVGDPHTWAEGVAALKGGIELIRTASGAVRCTIKRIRGNDPQADAADEQLKEALRSIEVAEVMIAKSLGFKLCFCANPPTPMLTVGYGLGRGGSPSGPVFECPTCEYNTAKPWAYYSNSTAERNKNIIASRARCPRNEKPQPLSRCGRG
jgi:hypothetical protein